LRDFLYCSLPASSVWIIGQIIIIIVAILEIGCHIFIRREIDRFDYRLTKVVRNTVEDVKFIISTMRCSVQGMALRMSPTNKRDKERLRQLKEEQDRIIRIIKGDKEVICQSTQVRIK
jgi:hypothetical protein